VAEARPRPHPDADRPARRRVRRADRRQTEHALFERFAAAARTGAGRGSVTILVSHRFSNVRMADLILVLEDGKLVEQGTHAGLMARRGLYAELYSLQARAYT
jgi:ATP-binding cassette, subfamily B, bacterial